MEEMVWSPSYYTRGALKTVGGCRASIAPAWIRHVDARTRVGVDAWTRRRVSRPFFFFFLDKSRKLSKILLVLQSASVERFDVSRMRDFYRGVVCGGCALLLVICLCIDVVVGMVVVVVVVGYCGKRVAILLF